MPKALNRKKEEKKKKAKGKGKERKVKISIRGTHQKTKFLNKL